MTEPTVDLQAGVRRPPAPGAESAGIPLTELVVEMHRAAVGLEALSRQAKREALERLHTGIATGNTDANGDVAIELGAVPQGATGYLMLASIDEAGVTPASPDTNANLWHAIYSHANAGVQSASQVAKIGAMLDCIPQSAVDAQIPFCYLYASRYAAPALIGPQVFYVVIDAATANRQIAVRYNILITQPEP